MYHHFIWSARSSRPSQLCCCSASTLSLECGLNPGESESLKIQVSGCLTSKHWTLTFPPTKGRMCIFPVRLSLTEATIRQVPQRMTCRSAHLCSWDLPFLTLNTPFSRVRSCWSAFTGRSGEKKSPYTEVSVDLKTSMVCARTPTPPVINKSS